jgi:PD-(D/E)XK nuclease superfamily
MISPSRWTSLVQCTAKGWADMLILDGRLPESLPSRGTLVGRFHHRLMEIAATVSSATELEAQTEDEIRLLQHEVAKYPHLRRAGSVSGWREINISASLAMRMFETRDQISGEGVLRVERELKSRDGHLVGRPDLFRIHGVGASVREYKTGAIRDEEGGVRSDYLDQVTLYAALIFDNFNVQTVEASLESLDGDRHEATIDRAAARDFSEHVGDTLVTVNEQARSARSLADLARPSADACRYCSSRTLCTPFKGTQDELGLKGDQFLTEGTVESIAAHSANGLTAIDLNDEFRNARIKLLLPTSVATEMSEGCRYQLINLQRRGTSLEWGYTSQALSYE